MRAATVWCAGAVTVAMALGGCTDLSGQIDDYGHNGYDKRTCTDFKTLAMDVEHETIDQDAGSARARELVAGSSQASDKAIRYGAVAYASAYLAGDEQAVEAAADALMEVCRF